MLSEIGQLLIYRKSWWYSIIQEICALYSKLLYLELNFYWHNTHTQSHAHTCTCAYTHKQTINLWLWFLLKVASLHFQRKYLESTFPARKPVKTLKGAEASTQPVQSGHDQEAWVYSSLFSVRHYSTLYKANRRKGLGKTWSNWAGNGMQKGTKWMNPHGLKSTSQHSVWITIPILLPSITLLTQAGEVVPTSNARHCGPGTVPELESVLKPCSCSSFH